MPFANLPIRSALHGATTRAAAPSVARRCAAGVLPWNHVSSVKTALCVSAANVTGVTNLSVVLVDDADLLFHGGGSEGDERGGREAFSRAGGCSIGQG